MKETKLKPCPKCRKSGKSLWIWRVVSGKFLGKFIDKYYIECPSCHWCGKSKYFLWRAKRAWNKEKRQ